MSLFNTTIHCKRDDSITRATFIRYISTGEVDQVMAFENNHYVLTNSAFMVHKDKVEVVPPHIAIIKITCYPPNDGRWYRNKVGKMYSVDFVSKLNGMIHLFDGSEHGRVQIPKEYCEYVRE